jgi:hypothetical protein
MQWRAGWCLGLCLLVAACGETSDGRKGGDAGGPGSGGTGGSAGGAGSPGSGGKGGSASGTGGGGAFGAASGAGGSASGGMPHAGSSGSSGSSGMGGGSGSGGSAGSGGSGGSSAACTAACDHVEGFCEQTAEECAAACEQEKTNFVDCVDEIDALMTCIAAQPEANFECSASGAPTPVSGVCSNEIGAYGTCRAM